MTQPVRADEGRRVLRNAASIGAFAMSPVIMWLMLRALGPAGYGRWWSTFVVNEAVGVLGSWAAGLYTRREVSRLTHEGRDEEIPAVVGSALCVCGSLGVMLLAVQFGLASSLARLHDDAELMPYLLVLGLQPVITNLTNVMGAALQSRNILGAIAVFGGIVFPVLTAAVLFASWQLQLPLLLTLALLVSLTLVGNLATMVVYARHLPLKATLRHVTRPVHVRDVLRFGAKLMLPVMLFIAGGKLDLYVLGASYDAVVVGIYAGCLQIASGLPNTRALLDPIIQTQVGALFGAEPHELGASLQRLTRICVFALAPGFVLLVAVGEPVLGWLLGKPAPESSIPLAILTVGQLIGSMAVASWVVPMMLSGRLLGAIAATTLVVKLALLLLLVPDFGMLGAAVATAVGTVIAMQGQALSGAYYVGHRPYDLGVLSVLSMTVVVAIASRVLYEKLADQTDQITAVVVTIGVSLAALGAAILALLRPDEREGLRRLVGLGRRPIPPP